jgi:hypothetical protein
VIWREVDIFGAISGRHMRKIVAVIDWIFCTPKAQRYGHRPAPPVKTLGSKRGKIEAAESPLFERSEFG